MLKAIKNWSWRSLADLIKNVSSNYITQNIAKLSPG